MGSLKRNPTNDANQNFSEKWFGQEGGQFAYDISEMLSSLFMESFGKKNAS